MFVMSFLTGPLFRKRNIDKPGSLMHIINFMDDVIMGWLKDLIRPESLTDINEGIPSIDFPGILSKIYLV